MKIEKLTDAPVDFLTGLIRKEKNAGWSEEGAEGIVQFLTSHVDRFIYLGAYSDDQKLAGVLAYESETMHLVLLGVDADYRHKGLATALIDSFVETAEEQHAARIDANAASGALGFYTAYGFEPCGEAMHVGGVDFTPVEYLLGRKMLGHMVTVTVDHPYGSFHPTLADVTYPVNFGYVSDPLPLQDGMQDAWVIGPQVPVETFKGVVVGIIYHKDGDSRWIVVQPGMVIDHQQIINLIGFEEQYYEAQILWAA